MQRIAPSQRLGEQLRQLVEEGAGAEVAIGELRGQLVRLGLQRMLQ